MDLMKARETMMRSSQSIMPFLAHREPARRMAFVSRHCRAQPMNTSTSRSFATSMRRQQDDDTASAVKSAPEQPARRPSVSDDISNILNSVSATRNVARYLPDQAGQRIMMVVTDSGGRPYGPWTGLAIMAGWVVAALIGGYLLVRRRDA